MTAISSANSTPKHPLFERKTITILLPAYNEAASLPRLHDCMLQVAQQNAGYDFEFLLVNDGSSDGTLDGIRALRADDPRFCYVDLSRNYGKETAMLAGFDHARGDAVIIMDADMQHPIDVIPDMISWWEQGYDDVYAARAESHETWFKRHTSQWYYRLLQRTTRVPIQQGAGDFRLLDRRCVDALRQMREAERNTKGMYSWIGFRKKGITYKQLTRQEGETKWSTAALVGLAMNGIMSYTTAPLRIVTVFGLISSCAAFVYLIYILVTTLAFGEPVAGYPTIMATMLFLGGAQLLGLGIIGEYLGRVFNEAKHRPGYFVESYNGDK